MDELDKQQLDAVTEYKTFLAQHSLLNAFCIGHGEKFFRLWKEHVPAKLRDHDAECRKLEFYLHIYFAVHPLVRADEMDVSVSYRLCHKWLHVTYDLWVSRPLSFSLSL